jgi:hypothetical protein
MKPLFIIAILHLLYFVSGELDLQNVEIPDIDIDNFTAIKEKCDKAGGSGTFDRLLASKESLQTCITNFVNVTVLANEVEESKKTGSMDEVFGKYCAKRSKVVTCVNSFISNLRPCLNAEENKALNVTLDILKQLGEFLCYRDGDRIAMFIAEGGVECIKSHTEGIQNCVTSTFKINATVNMNSVPNLLMDKKKCDDLGKLQNCVVEELEKCKDSTPANIIDALFRFIKRSACSNKNKRSVYAHGIFKRSAAFTYDIYNVAQVREKVINIIKEKCSLNGPEGSAEAFIENLENTISCFANKTKSGPFFASSADTAKQYIKNCTEKLIEKTEICLPDEEKHWPKFCLEVAQNVIDFFFANKNTIIEMPRAELTNCFQNLKRHRRDLIECLNFSNTKDLRKEAVCGRLVKTKTCFSEQIRKRCVPDVTITKLNNDYFDAVISPCNKNQ